MNWAAPKYLSVLHLIKVAFSDITFMNWAAQKYLSLRFALLSRHATYLPTYLPSFREDVNPCLFAFRTLWWGPIQQNNVLKYDPK